MCIVSLVRITHSTCATRTGGSLVGSRTRDSQNGLDGLTKSRHEVPPFAHRGITVTLQSEHAALLRSVGGVIIDVVPNGSLHATRSTKVGGLEAHLSQSHHDMVQNACMPNFERAILFPHLVE